jgi:hypothetical protein
MRNVILNSSQSVEIGAGQKVVSATQLGFQGNWDVGNREVTQVNSAGETW